MSHPVLRTLQTPPLSQTNEISAIPPLPALFYTTAPANSLWEEIQNLEIVRYLDVCVDGEFEVDKKELLLKWKGSSNQRVIDVPASLREGKAVLYQD